MMAGDVGLSMAGIRYHVAARDPGRRREER